MQQLYTIINFSKLSNEKSHTKVNQSSVISKHYNLTQYLVHNSHSLKIMTTNNIIIKFSLIYKSFYIITVFNLHDILSAYFLTMLSRKYQKKTCIPVLYSQIIIIMKKNK